MLPRPPPASPPPLLIKQQVNIWSCYQQKLANRLIPTVFETNRLLRFATGRLFVIEVITLGSRLALPSENFFFVVVVFLIIGSSVQESDDLEHEP